MYDHILILPSLMSLSPSLTSISPSLTCILPSLTSILPSLALSKPSFAHLTIIEKLHRLDGGGGGGRGEAFSAKFIGFPHNAHNSILSRIDEMGEDIVRSAKEVVLRKAEKKRWSFSLTKKQTVKTKYSPLLVFMESSCCLLFKEKICTVLYCTVLYCTVLYCTVLYCTVLRWWV